MYCKKCGKFLAGHINYCSNCGAKVEHETGEDRVKVFAPVDEMRWDDRAQGHEAKDKSAQEPSQHDYNWSSDPVYARIAEARKLREQRIADVDLPSTDILEKEMEAVNKDEIDDSRKKIEKFYTFSKKREEFQKLLDQEQERIEKKKEKPETHKKLEQVMDFSTENFHKATEEVEQTQAAQMARARRAMFGVGGMDSEEWDKFTDESAEKQAEKRKAAIRQEELQRQKQLVRQQELDQEEARRAEELRKRREEIARQAELARRDEVFRREELQRQEMERIRAEREHQAELMRIAEEREQEERERRLAVAKLAAERATSEMPVADLEAEESFGLEKENTDDLVEDNAEVVFVDTPKTVEVTEEENNEKGNNHRNHSRSDDAGHRSGAVNQVRDVTGAEGKASAETDPQGKKTDSQGAPQESGRGKEVSQAGAERQASLARAKVVIDPEIEKEKSEKQAKTEEIWQDEDDDENKPGHGKLASFFIGLLTAIIFILACLICIRLFMLNSMVSQYMDKGTKAVYSFLGIEGKTDEGGGGGQAQNVGARDKSSLISLEADKNYKGMLEEIKSDTDLVFTDEMVNEHAELADLEDLDNKLFFEEDDKEIFIDQVIVGRVIDYMSKSKAYLIKGDRAVFESIDDASDMESVLQEQKRKWNIKPDVKHSIDIGEIRQKGQTYYLLINDKLSDGQAKKKLIQMRDVGNDLLVSNRLELK